MEYNKIIYGDETLIDLTQDTVTPDTLAKGMTAHDASGASIVGTMEGGIDTSDATATSSTMLNNVTAYARGGKITGSIPTLYRENSSLSYGALTFIAPAYYPNQFTITAPRDRYITIARISVAQTSSTTLTSSHGVNVTLKDVPIGTIKIAGFFYNAYSSSTTGTITFSGTSATRVLSAVYNSGEMTSGTQYTLTAFGYKGKSFSSTSAILSYVPITNIKGKVTVSVSGTTAGVNAEITRGSSTQTLHAGTLSVVLVY